MFFMGVHILGRHRDELNDLTRPFGWMAIVVGCFSIVALLMQLYFPRKLYNPVEVMKEVEREAAEQAEKRKD